MVLSSKQIRYLRALGHHLVPVAMVGKEGITDKLVRSVAEVLKARELIKVKVQKNCPYELEEVANMLTAATKGVAVQIIGRIILLFKPNKDLKEDKRIHLPS